MSSTYRMLRLVIVFGLLLAVADSVRADFTTVLNVSDYDVRIGGYQSIGSDTQLNLFDGGRLPLHFQAGNPYETNTNVEVNIFGGLVDPDFHANSGSTVNISGGNVWAGGFRANSGSIVNVSGGSVGNNLLAFSNSTVNISGGNVGYGFRALLGSTVNISGGNVDFSFRALSGSTVSISGGTIKSSFRAYAGSAVNISGGNFGHSFVAVEGSAVDFSGGEFLLNGVEYMGDSITLDVEDVFTGRLADGTAFIFNHRENYYSVSDYLTGVTLARTALPAIDLTPIVINTPLQNNVSNLSPGQTLTLLEGGELRNGFASLEATLNLSGGSVGTAVNMVGGTTNISGGAVGTYFNAYHDSTVNISGGDVDDHFGANSGSTVNISGGTVGSNFNANSGSSINLLGAGFLIDGVPLTGLVAGEAFTIIDRNVSLAGIFADGSPIDFDLFSAFMEEEDYIDVNATLTVTLLPEDFLAGDFNGDGSVDAADYTVWRDSVGQDADTLTNNYHFGTIGQAEYDTWVENFGRSLDGTTATSVATSVPEPGTLLLALFASVGLMHRTRR